MIENLVKYCNIHECKLVVFLFVSASGLILDQRKSRWSSNVSNMCDHMKGELWPVDQEGYNATIPGYYTGCQTFGICLNLI